MAVSAKDVIDAYGPALARIAAAYERDPALREELVQDMFLAVVTSLPRLREPEKLKGYVLRIGQNCAVRHVVRRMRDPVAAGETGEAPDEAPSQEQSMIEGERSAALFAAIRSLGLPYRQVITLVLEGLGYPEIAEALGISVSNVGVRLNRAKEQLRERLA